MNVKDEFVQKNQEYGDGRSLIRVEWLKNPALVSKGGV